MKKFISSFSKRVAVSIKPNECQECECHSDNNGIPYYECISCAFPTPVNFDFVSYQCRAKNTNLYRFTTDSNSEYDILLQGIEDESELQGVLDSDS